MTLHAPLSAPISLESLHEPEEVPFERLEVLGRLAGRVWGRVRDSGQLLTLKDRTGLGEGDPWPVGSVRVLQVVREPDLRFGDGRGGHPMTTSTHV